MAQVEHILPGEVLLKRLPPKSTKNFPGLGLGARYQSLRPRKNGDLNGASYTRFPPTTPLNLLNHLTIQEPPIAPEGWLACWVLAQEVLALGIDIVLDEQPHDVGHCLLDPHLTATMGLWQQLAERTVGRIISYELAPLIETPSDLPGWGD